MSIGDDGFFLTLESTKKSPAERMHSPRFPDLGDPEDASSGTLDGVMWMSAFVVKVHEDHFATWRADG